MKFIDQDFANLQTACCKKADSEAMETRITGALFEFGASLSGLGFVGVAHKLVRLTFREQASRASRGVSKATNATLLRRPSAIRMPMPPGMMLRPRRRLAMLKGVAVHGNLHNSTTVPGAMWVDSVLEPRVDDI